MTRKPMVIISDFGSHDHFQRQIFINNERWYHCEKWVAGEIERYQNPSQREIKRSGGQRTGVVFAGRMATRQDKKNALGRGPRVKTLTSRVFGRYGAHLTARKRLAEWPTAAATLESDSTAVSCGTGFRSRSSGVGTVHSVMTGFLRRDGGCETVP